MIESLLGKISRYEIITNLIPGALLAFILERIGFSIFAESAFINVLICYYVGLINNRFSSLCVEEPLKRWRLIQWRDYDKYNRAKKDRPFIATLQETANQYRSFTSVFILSILAIGYHSVQNLWYFAAEYGNIFIIVLLFFLFFFSYRKQVNEYVVKSIDEAVNDKDTSSDSACPKINKL